MTKIWMRIAEVAFAAISLGMVAEGLWEIFVYCPTQTACIPLGAVTLLPLGLILVAFWASFRVGRFLIGRRERALREQADDLQEPR